MGYMGQYHRAVTENLKLLNKASFKQRRKMYIGSIDRKISYKKRELAPEELEAIKRDIRQRIKNRTLFRTSILIFVALSILVFMFGYALRG